MLGANRPKTGVDEESKIEASNRNLQNTLHRKIALLLSTSILRALFLLIAPKQKWAGDGPTNPTTPLDY